VRCRVGEPFIKSNQMTLNLLIYERQRIDKLIKIMRQPEINNNLFTLGGKVPGESGTRYLNQTGTILIRPFFHELTSVPFFQPASYWFHLTYIDCMTPITLVGSNFAHVLQRHH
jgi:hypothetical protein